MAKCDQCAELATHSTTDAVQTQDGGWKETKTQRFGCNTPAHAVFAQVHLSDGRVMSVREYETLYH